MKPRSIVFLFALLCLWHTSRGQKPDTTHHAVTLPAVSIVNPNAHPEELRVQTPTQVVAATEMDCLGNTLLSDAARRLTGVTLKDYGGVGGVKTVSARGLGSQFSTLTLDGVAVNDCQNGQVDLGRYTLGGSSYIAFSNGQADNLLQSARAVAGGNVLNMETAVPEFRDRPFMLAAGVDGGSFGFVSPTLSFAHRLGRRASFSLWSNYTRSEGDYPFRLYYTAGHADSSSVERRENSQMRMGIADANLFYRIDSERQIHVKTHLVKGFHALPGPVIYYAHKASEHTEEGLFFAQARYRREGRRWRTQLLGKMQWSTDVYEDTAARTATGLLRNDYGQSEGYLSEAVQYFFGNRAESHWSVALSADEALSQLHSNLAQHSEVQRLSAYGVLAAEYRSAPSSPTHEGLRLKASLLGTFVRDEEGNASDGAYCRLSPYAGASYTRGGLTLRYFFKENYRVPNFNELYYFTVGRSLRPERALQHNAGASYCHARVSAGAYSWDYALSVDGYYNRVSDKIVAVPTQNMFLWSMSNIGRAEVGGVDVTCSTSLRTGADNGTARRWDIDMTAGYSYQYAVDRTTPGGKTYGHQIPYTPRHSGSVALTASTQGWDAGYSITLVGARYSMGQNIKANRLEGYADHGISVSRHFQTKHGHLNVRAQVLNVFDVQYEVVKSYPMMGRNYRIGFKWEV